MPVPFGMVEVRMSLQIQPVGSMDNLQVLRLMPPDHLVSRVFAVWDSKDRYAQAQEDAGQVS
jgi:hypothetical protein